MTENIDKIEEIVLKKQRKPRARKGNNPLLAAEKKAEPGIPELVSEGTRAYEIAKMIEKGMTVHQIAEKYGFDEATIKRTMALAVEKIHEAAAPIIMNWVAVTINRTEHMLSKLYDQLTDRNDRINDTIYDRMQKIIDQQQRVLELLVKKSGKEDKSGDTYNFNQTIVTSSPLYKEGNQAIGQFRAGSQPDREAEISDLDNPFGGDVIVYPSNQ